MLVPFDFRRIKSTSQVLHRRFVSIRTDSSRLSSSEFLLKSISNVANAKQIGGERGTVLQVICKLCELVKLVAIAELDLTGKQLTRNVQMK